MYVLSMLASKKTSWLQVGVDVNGFVGTPWKGSALPFVSGLGTRKAAAVQRAVQQRKGVDSRKDLWTPGITGRNVFRCVCTAVLHMWQPVIADGLLRTCKLGLRIAAWVELQASRGQDLLSGVNAGDLGGCWYWRRGWLCLTGFRADRLVMCLACVHPKQLKFVKMVCCKPRP